ncbi:MAG: choline dehydrogenase [Acidimicrobiaceae bacterium]|nr:choline dehydrogenase [Acidimicrobiaceae bacterium]MYE98062.1 choline dehydrogenase [Acidimicrobiaceae bacterium]MYI54859.1 choline dehydrogenase [Acidimicrobiaceae bacterium]
MADRDRRYDYVIVGGGSAGCALANRLSADSSTSVLVLEAGRRDWRFDVYIHMPAALSFPIGNRFYDWQYTSEPEPHMGGRRVYHARGKVLGGSSSINGMIFQRGNPLDYQRWAADPGMERWDYAHCLPYFKRMEQCLAGDDHSGPPSSRGRGAYRGDQGPLVLERGPATNPLFEAFLQAAEQAGHPRTADVNGYRQEGFAAFDRNVHRGRRLSASQAYLHPVLSRPNLHLVTRALTTRILFEGDRATGVTYTTYTKGGRSRTVNAGEVICCGGAINSPQLLQLSGVGPAGLLHRHGIDVVADVPAVGANMQDHLEVYVQYACKQPVSMQPHLAKWRRPWIGLQWLARRGPAATNHFEAGGFIRSNDDVAYPNLMFHFLPIAIRYDGSVPEGGHGYQVHVGPMYSNSRGTVAIVSTDPRTKPALRFNYLSTEEDRREWVEAVRHARHILDQPAMDPFNGGEVSPGPSVITDEEILDWVRRDAETALHPSCTARMGLGDDSALHPDSLEVHGTTGLRVVDASSMPYVTNGNIYAPVMMLAEKAADLILGNTPLPPEPVDFYRADSTGVT